MNATIMQRIENRHAVFGFAQASHIDETAWLQAIGKSCSGTSCEVPAGRLIEFASLDKEKQQAIGFDLKEEGYWVGLEISNKELWKRIASGDIASFEMNLTPGGLSLDFEQKTKDKGVSKMLTNETIITTGCCGVVRKCVTAVEKGDAEGVSKKDFEDALDALAKAHAAEHRMNYHKAYVAVLKSDLGSALYNGVIGAPLSSRPVRKSGEGAAWAEIRKQAQELQAEDEDLSEAQAVTRVLESDPELYAAYLREQSA